MRKTLIENLTQGPLTEPAPTPDEAGLAELAKRVSFELYSTDAFNTLAIQVKADQGTVTLSGTVRSKAEQLLAERVVQSVSGVKKVTNDLKVSAASVGQ